MLVLCSAFSPYSASYVSYYYAMCHTEAIVGSRLNGGNVKFVICKNKNYLKLCKMIFLFVCFLLLISGSFEKKITPLNSVLLEKVPLWRLKVSVIDPESCICKYTWDCPLAGQGDLVRNRNGPYTDSCLCHIVMQWEMRRTSQCNQLVQTMTDCLGNAT